MKKVLLASTALVLSAGVAAAEVAVGGGASIWLADDGADTTVNNSITVNFSGSGETDGGLGFGFDYALIDATSDHDHGTFTGTGLDGGGAAGVDNWEVYISSGGFKLTVGDPDDADQMAAGMGDIGFDGLGVDNVAERGRGDAAGGILASVSMGDFSFYASHDKDLDGDDYALGAKASFGDWTVGLGMNDNAGDQTVVAGLDGSISGLGVDLYVEDNDTDGSSYGVILSYGMDATTVSFGYADTDATGVDAAMGIGFAYDLGGGAELAGGVADNGSETVWDVGISMSF